jgi:transposase
VNKVVNSEDVIEEYYSGYNFSQIARNLGCSRNTVKKYIKQYVVQTGNIIRIRTASKFSPQDILDIKELRKDGIFVTEISEMYGVTTSYIYRILREY